MCISPISIPNPYYGLGMVGINCLHNTLDTYITVPCGSCQQCVSLRQMWYVQRVQMESLRSHLYMITLTYKDEALKFLEGSDTYNNLSYPFYQDVQYMIKRIRRKGYSLRYWFSSEYGTLHHRPHYHGIIALDKSIYTDSPLNYEEQFRKIFMKEWRRNIASDGEPSNFISLSEFIFSNRGSTFDFHYIEPFQNHENDTSFYVGKYIIKYDDWTNKLLAKISLDPNLNEEQVLDFVSKLKPRSYMSKDFGDYKYPPIRDYILECLKLDDKLPQYFDYYTGKSSLLSRYYRKHLVPFSWYKQRFVKYSQSLDSLDFVDNKSIQDYNISSEKSLELQLKWKKIKQVLNNTYF